MTDDQVIVYLTQAVKDLAESIRELRLSLPEEESDEPEDA